MENITNPCVDTSHFIKICTLQQIDNHTLKEFNHVGFEKKIYVAVNQKSFVVTGHILHVPII